MEEIWKEIPGFDGRYEASDYGRIRAWNYRRGGKRQSEPLYICTWISKIGYHHCKLHKEGKSQTHSVHRLVLLAFVGPSDLDCNHKDGNKNNNYLDNLEYLTHTENAIHARDVLGCWIGKKRYNPPTERDQEIRALAAQGVSQRAIAKHFTISQPYVQYIVSSKVRANSE